VRAPGEYVKDALNQCAPGQNCFNGRCGGHEMGCPSYQEWCEPDGCVNMDNDNRHCGQCDNQVRSAESALT
jgi:hypothetical protein